MLVKIRDKDIDLKVSISKGQSTQGEIIGIYSTNYTFTDSKYVKKIYYLEIDSQEE
jgi:hypothetical protein